MARAANQPDGCGGSGPTALRSGRRPGLLLRTTLGIVTLVLLGGCGTEGGGSSSGEGPSGRDQYDFDADERCLEDDYGCNGGTRAVVGTEFVDGDAWTVRYRGTNVFRGETGDSVNPFEFGAQAFFDITNDGDQPAGIDAFDVVGRFDALAFIGGRSISTCAGIGEHLPGDAAEIAPGQTITIVFCFYESGLENMFEGSVTVRLQGACLDCEADFLGDEQPADETAAGDVRSSIEAIAENTGLTPTELGMERWMDRYSDEPEDMQPTPSVPETSIGRETDDTVPLPPPPPPSTTIPPDQTVPLPDR